MGKSSINGQFSMAMLNNQRVYLMFKQIHVTHVCLTQRNWGAIVFIMGGMNQRFLHQNCKK